MQTSAGVAASNFRLDVKGTEVREAFRVAGIESVLLKGRAFDHLLYAATGARRYSDVDILVDPARTPAAEAILEGLGFRRLDEESLTGQTDAALGRAIGALGEVHGGAWQRDEDRFVLDLHDSLPQVDADASTVWEQVTQHVDVLEVCGVPTEILDRPASALLIALHAAHHGPQWNHGLDDLQRAIELFELDCWREAQVIARRLDAERGLGVGLGLLPSGSRIAAELSLGTAPSSALRLLWAGAPWSAGFIDSLLAHPGVRDRGRLLAGVLWPSPLALQRGSRLARRGRRGLAAAYFLRPFQLMRRLPVGLLARHRLRGSG